MLTNGAVFEDLGEDYFQRTHASSTRHNAINQPTNSDTKSN